jgi:drug/metabolite transporter (DMT)-like permease
MKREAVTSDALLLITAAIWGFAFTAQRAGMDFIGPFLYSGIRFLLGTAVRAPVWLVRGRRKGRRSNPLQPKPQRPRVLEDAPLSKLLKAGAVAGIFLFCGVNLQQVGLLYTTAGKAGFITGLYVIIVPFLGLFLRQRAPAGTWVGAVFAVTGLYLLSFAGVLEINTGDLLMLGSAFCWALHLHAISRFAATIDSVKLATVQYFFCGIFSLVIAVLIEPFSPQAILEAAIPLLYGGACSVGIGYTLQVIAQKSAPTTHAAIIMSLESVFAALGGFLILGETLSARGLAGCGLMLCGMVISQLYIGRARVAANRQ